MSGVNAQHSNEINGDGESNRPDFIAKQCRMVTNSKGLTTHFEKVGVASKNENGSVCFRPFGE